ncbi:MAG: hypothetical protein H6737_22615 [Alphaproteobacteria bacterium]|nr:hypothetical protein [Alphaproteobacteria bacterium]
MVTQNEVKNAQATTTHRADPPSWSGGEDGVAIGFALLGGLLWAAANIAACMLVTLSPAAAWTVGIVAWAVYFPGLAIAFWRGAAIRQEV